MLNKLDCPKCGKTLIRLEPFENDVYKFFCDECDIDITIEDIVEKEKE